MPPAAPAPFFEDEGPTDSTDAEVHRWRSGDPAAFERLHVRFAPYLTGLVLHSSHWAVLRRWHQLEDVVQEIWTTAVASAGRNFEPRGKGSLAAWLRAVAHNHMRGLCRHHGAQKHGEGRDPDPLETGMERSAGPTPGRSVPETPTGQARYDEMVDRAKSLLPEREFLAWYFIEILDCSAREAAEAMGPQGGSDAAVRSLLMRGRWKLTQDLRDRDDERGR